MESIPDGTTRNQDKNPRQEAAAGKRNLLILSTAQRLTVHDSREVKHTLLSSGVNRSRSFPVSIVAVLTLS